MMSTPTLDLIPLYGAMDFAHRLAAIRKDKGLTQQVLADRIGIHVSQVRRYEAGTNQPTLDVLRAMAVALSVTTDTLVFTEAERGPEAPDLRLAFEATTHLDPDEQAMVRNLVEAIQLRHEVRKITSPTG